MIEFRSVTKGFGTKSVLNNVSFWLQKGQVTFLIGRSGVGKSVCLKLMVGLLSPDSGEFLFDEKPTAGFSHFDWMKLRRRCALIFQNPALVDSMTLFDNLSLASPSRDRKWICQKLAEVGLSEDCLDKTPLEVSLGTQKRASIARALVLESECLLFDEPTTGLDPINTTRINALIGKLSKSGKTIAVVSHDMQCALGIADRILLVDNGKIAVDSTPETVREESYPLLKDFLKEADARAIEKPTP